MVRQDIIAKLFPNLLKSTNVQIRENKYINKYINKEESIPTGTPDDENQILMKIV